MNVLAFKTRREKKKWKKKHYLKAFERLRQQQAQLQWSEQTIYCVLVCMPV